MATKEMEIRAQIDQENVKGLLLINGGASVALIAFLPHVLPFEACANLSEAILWGLLAYQAGIVCAVVHNWQRRRCSMEWERHAYKPPGCYLLGPGAVLVHKLSEPASA